MKSSRWIPVREKTDLMLLPPGELVAMSQADYYKTQNQVLLEYLPVIQLDAYTGSRFLDDFGIFHFSVNQVDAYRQLLRMVAAKYPEPEKVPDKIVLNVFITAFSVTFTIA